MAEMFSNPSDHNYPEDEVFHELRIPDSPYLAGLRLPRDWVKQPGLPPSGIAQWQAIDDVLMVSVTGYRHILEPYEIRNAVLDRFVAEELDQLSQDDDGGSEISIDAHPNPLTGELTINYQYVIPANWGEQDYSIPFSIAISALTKVNHAYSARVTVSYQIDSLDEKNNDRLETLAWHILNSFRVRDSRTSHTLPPSEPALN